MKKDIATKTVGNILFCLYYDVDSRTEFFDDKPVGDYCTYLSLTWVDKYGDQVGYGCFNIDIPVNDKRLKDIGTWLIEAASKL